MLCTSSFPSLLTTTGTETTTSVELKEMDDMLSLWNYQESVDGLKEMLLLTKLELDSVRMKADEEMRKNEEQMKQLWQDLQVASQERDEALNHLQKILNKPIPSQNLPLNSFPQPDSPLLKPVRANSSITESNSHGSSPVNSLFDPVSSPEFMSDSSQMVFMNQPYNVSPKCDRGDLVINEIAKGKVLPQKGKLMQSVLQAGPLLQTLLVAGPLPRWRNPPPLQPLQIPPVSIRGCESEMKPTPNIGGFIPKSSSNFEMNCAASQMVARSPMLNFVGGSSAVSMAASGDTYAQLGKRHRLI